MKEKTLFKDKERILLNTFDALKKLDDSKEQRKSNVIDIADEEENNGTTSEVFKCELCDFQASMEHRFKQHMNDKHKKSNQTDQSSGRHASFSDDVIIPCDACSYIAKSAEDFLSHTETQHGEGRIKCEKCDFVSMTVDNLKSHLLQVHSNQPSLRSIGTQPNNKTELITIELAPTLIGAYVSFQRRCVSLNTSVCQTVNLVNFVEENIASSLIIVKIILGIF